MFENGKSSLLTSEKPEKNWKSNNNSLKLRLTLGENYKPTFDPKAVPNLKNLKKMRVGKPHFAFICFIIQIVLWTFQTI